MLAVDPADLRVMAKIAVGEHPNQIAVHPEGRPPLRRLRVEQQRRRSSTRRRGIVTETIATALFPSAPEGSTPDALAVAPDGKTLYVANADNNCVAVIDIEHARTGARSRASSRPAGIRPPSPSRPTARRLLVGVGKGNQTKPNPIDRGRTGRFETGPPSTASAEAAPPFPYIGSTLSGALVDRAVPDDKTLAAYTETVYRTAPIPTSS